MSIFREFVGAICCCLPYTTYEWKGGKSQDLKRLSDWRAHPTLREYNLEEHIADGGFSEVWRARHRTTSEEVCIKVVYLRKPGLRPEDAEVLRGEARYLRHLDHPNLLRCHNVFETKYHMVMILDYLSGGEMLEHLHHVEHYTEATAARLFAQIAGAVAYLHNLNIVHRDIKPENIMFARRVEDCLAQGRPLRVKVIDLGMATVIMPPPLLQPAGVVGGGDPQHQQLQRSMRQEKQRQVLGKQGRSRGVGPAPCGCLGSPGFIAPEVVRGKPHTLAMDVYSLGVLLFIMLTGRKPWTLREARSLEYARRSISEAPGLKDSSFLSLSSSARELLLSMLADDPRNRLTALEVLRHPFIARFNAATAGSPLTPLRPLDDIIKRRIAQLASLRRFRGLAFAMMSDRGEGQRLGEFLEHVAERRKSVHKDLLSRAKQRRAVVVQRRQSDTQQDQLLGSSALPLEPRKQAASAGKTFGAVTAFTGVAPVSRTSIDSCSSQQALLPSRHRYVPSHLQPGMPEGQQLTSRHSLDSTASNSSHQPLLPVAATAVTAPTTDGGVGGRTAFLFSHHIGHQHNAHPPPQPWFGTSIPANRSNHTRPVRTAEVLGSGHVKVAGDAATRHISGNGGGSGGNRPLRKPHTVHHRHHLDTVLEPEDAGLSLAGSQTHGSASHPHNSNARNSLGGGRPSDNTALQSAALPDAVAVATSSMLSLNSAHAAKLQTTNTCSGSNGIGRRRGWSISGSQQTHPDAATAASTGASTFLSPSAGAFTPPSGPPPLAPCRNERARSSQHDVWRRRGRFATCVKGAEVELATLDPLGLVRELPGVVGGRLGRAHSAPESVSVLLGLGTWGDVDGKGVGSAMGGAHAGGRGRRTGDVGEEAGAAGEDQAAWMDGCALGADMRAFSANSWTLDLLANMDLLAALTGFNMANRNSSSELDLSVYNSTLYESGHYISAASSVLPQAPSYNWHGGAGYGAHPMTASPAAAAAAAVANFHQLQSELSRCQTPSLALDGPVHAGSHAAALLAAAVAVVEQSAGGTAATDGSIRGGTSAAVVRRTSREVWPAVAAAISAAVAATASDRSGSNGGHRLMVSTQPSTTPTRLPTDSSGGGNPMGGGGTPSTKVSLGREMMNGAALSYPCRVSPFMAYACLPSSSWEVRMSDNGATGTAAQQRPLLSTPVRTVHDNTALAAMQAGYRVSGAGGAGGSEVVEIGSNAFFSARSGIAAGLTLPEHSSLVLTSALAHVGCQDAEQPRLLLRATHRLGTGAVSASGLDRLSTAVSYGSPYTPRHLAMTTSQGGRVCVLRPAGYRGASSPAMTPHRSYLVLKDLDEQIDAHRASLEETLHGGNNLPWACPSRSPAMSEREEAVSIGIGGTTTTCNSNAAGGGGEPTIGAAVQGGPALSGACVGSTPSRLGAAGPGFNPNLTGSVRVIRTTSPLARITESADAAWVTAAEAEAGTKERWRGAPVPAGPDEAMCGGTWHSGRAVAGTALLAPVRSTPPVAAAAAVEPTSAAGTAPAAIKSMKSVEQGGRPQVGNGVCGYEQYEVAVAAHAGRPDSTAAAPALVGSRWRSPFEVMAAVASGDWGANAAACHGSSSGRAGAPFM